MSSRPDIPSEIARQVRQICGYGCVICGCPIYHYDHIVDYSIVKEHTIDNLVLLCPTHHQEKTNKLITRDFLRKAKEESILRTRTSKHVFRGSFCSLILGCNLIDSFSGCLFSINGFGWASVRFDDGPLISITLLDDNGEKAIEVVESVFTLCSKTWDIEFVGNKLTFRNGLRKVFAQVTLIPENNLVILEGNFAIKGGGALKLTNKGIFLGRTLLAFSNHIDRCQTGILVSNDDFTCATICVGNANITHNVFIKSDIGVLNTNGCSYNHFIECNKAFVWNEDYLRSLSGSR